MKRGKNPTRAEKAVIASYNLNPANWLICKKVNDMYTLEHRHTGKIRQIPMDPVRKLG
ncbi:DUF6906 family protein [Domibacillus tundrae]|uniref:DUF6906 family protein n=1 Tax=Domibacillus tundrae TaxID=1587527 RepID=UPI000A8EC944|nr:hypothetical protein [Domibacillus tundrae]